MKDEVEKLLIELQVKNATSIAIDGHLNEKDLVSATKKLLTIIQKAQVEAVRAELNHLLSKKESVSYLCDAPDCKRIGLVEEAYFINMGTMQDRLARLELYNKEGYVNGEIAQLISDNIDELFEDGETK